MFDKLIDVFVLCAEHLSPGFVVKHYNRGVRLRWGKDKCKQVLKPGYYWKWPVADKIITVMVKPTTMRLDAQTITTKDWKTIVAESIIKYDIADAKTLVLEVNDATDAIADMAAGIIRDTFIQLDWKDCNDVKIPSQITEKVKSEAIKWGVNVHSVTLRSLGEMRTIRLMGAKNIDT